MNLTVTCSAISTDRCQPPIQRDLPDGSRMVQYHGSDYCTHYTKEFYSDTAEDFLEVVDDFCSMYGYDKKLIKMGIGYDHDIELSIKLSPILEES